MFLLLVSIFFASNIWSMNNNARQDYLESLASSVYEQNADSIRELTQKDPLFFNDIPGFDNRFITEAENFIERYIQNKETLNNEMCLFKFCRWFKHCQERNAKLVAFILFVEVLSRHNANLDFSILELAGIESIVKGAF